LHSFVLFHLCQITIYYPSPPPFSLSLFANLNLEKKKKSGKFWKILDKEIGRAENVPILEVSSVKK